MRSSPVRVGVVGTGFGTRVHVPAWRRTGKVDVVALSGQQLQKTQKAAAEARIGRACSSLTELIESGVDVVSLAVPPFVSHQLLGALASKGLPVICDKPPTTSAFETAALARAVEKLKVPIGVNFEFSELTTFRSLKSLLEREDLGKLEEVSVRWLSRSRPFREGSRSWKLQSKTGGGVLSLLGVHVTCLIEWLLGPVASVRAICSDENTRRLEEGDPAADTAVFEMETESGVVVRGEISTSTDGPVHHWSFRCKKGRIDLKNEQLDPVSGFVLSVTGAEPSSMQEPGDAQDGRIAASAQLFERFLSSLETSAPFWPNLTTAARAQQLTDALLHSSEARIPLRVSHVDTTQQ